MATIRSKRPKPQRWVWTASAWTTWTFGHFFSRAAARDLSASMATTEHFYARLRVTRMDGSTVETYVDRPLGRDRDHALACFNDGQLSP